MSCHCSLSFRPGPLQIQTHDPKHWMLSHDDSINRLGKNNGSKEEQKRSRNFSQLVHLSESLRMPVNRKTSIFSHFCLFHLFSAPISIAFFSISLSLSGSLVFSRRN